MSNLYAIPLRCLVLGVSLLAFEQAGAQGVVHGRVTDEATARPIAGVLVRIAAGGSDRTTRTDEQGLFRFNSVGIGRLSFSARVLGFEPHTQQIQVTDSMPAMKVELRRLVMLDPVKVRAAKQGLFGVVASASDLRPLPYAELKIMGVGGGFIPLDSTAHFFVPVNTVGSYFLRAKAPGFDPQTITVLVSPNNAVEVAFLLDSTGQGSNHQEEWVMGLLDDRIKRRGLMSALVTRGELFERGHKDLEFALLFARSFASRGLVLGRQVCIFVDGVPRPGIPLATFTPEDIQAIEVYGPSKRSGDVSGTLADRWPRFAPCSDTGRPNSGGTVQLVKWVSIWLKQ